MHEYLVSYCGTVDGEVVFGGTVITMDRGPLKSADLPLVHALIDGARAKDGRLELINPVILSVHKFER